jgi:hypothetical protein
MSNAVWSARRENKINTVKQLKKIKLTIDDAGQYQHDDVIKLIEQLKQVTKEQFNPLDKTNGMCKLFEKTQNTINSITTQHAYNYKDILKKSKDETYKASTKETTVKPDITTRQEAQDEADRLNQIYQAVLGVKEGFKEKICDSGGTDALSSVLQQADIKHKSIDDYTLYELTEARIAGAHRPKAMHILKQIVSAITMQFNFRKKVMDNVALQKILVNKATTFGVIVHVSLLVINLEANMEYAQSHEWGREFRVSGQAIRKKYPDYTYKHDQASYDDMVKEYAAADQVRVLGEAPAPSDEQANQVGAFGGQLVALQRAFNDYEESAFSVDEDSGRSKSKKKKKKKKKKKDDESSSGRSKHRSKSRRRSKSTEDRKVKNKCKHCKEEHPYAGKHEEEKCFYNKKYKGWRPSKICKQLDKNSNVATNILRTWAVLRAVHQKKAAAAAKVTVETPAMNDGVGARMMKIG